MYFILTYTHKCKEYCDEEFFNALGKLPHDKFILCVIDNTENSREYFYRLETVTKNAGLEDVMIHHLELPQFEEFKHRFLSNVCESANFGRDIFLHLGEKYPGMFTHLITIESDVIVPPDLLESFDEALEEEPDIDICGGLYYGGMHDPAYSDPNNNILDMMAINIFSGCTMYSYRLLKDLEFRWEIDDTKIFPDSFMNYDAREKGFKTANYNKIKCKHLRGGW